MLENPAILIVVFLEPPSSARPETEPEMDPPESEEGDFDLKATTSSAAFTAFRI